MSDTDTYMISRQTYSNERQTNKQKWRHGSISIHDDKTLLLQNQ